MSNAPVIPYVQVHDLVLLGEGAFGDFPPFALRLHPFGVLVAAGVYAGAALAVRHGRRLGLDSGRLASFMTWVGGGGFLAGHVLDSVLYYPTEVARDPWLLLRFWDGLSSFGGFAGALMGALLWKWRMREPILPYSDVVAASFPVGLALGRGGCALVHDHVGIRSDAWFAVRFPGGGRLDLGLLEFALLLPIAATLLVLQRRRRPAGFFLAVLTLAYAPSRFALDFLRLDGPPAPDLRYGGLTPAQWGCVGLVVAGGGLFVRTLRIDSDQSGQSGSAAAPTLSRADSHCAGQKGCAHG